MKREKLDELKVKDLREYAKKYKIPKYSRMRKDELIDKIIRASAKKAQKPLKKLKEAKKTKSTSAKTSVEKKTSEFEVMHDHSQARLRMKEAFGASDNIDKKYTVEKHPVKEVYTDPFATPELPFEYGSNRIAVLVVDPSFIFTYWDISHEKFQNAQNAVGWDSKLTLRIYDVTDIEFNGNNAHTYTDTEIYERVGCWYLKLNSSNRSLLVDIGLKDSKGMFHIISRSNFAKLPPLHMAPEGPIKWMAVDDLGNYVITDIEEYTEADLVLLRKILGDELFARFMSGDFKGMLFSTVFKKVPNIKNISLELPTSSFFKIASSKNLET